MCMLSDAAPTPYSVRVDGVPGGGRPEFPSSPQSYHEHESHVFEIKEGPAKYSYEQFFFTMYSLEHWPLLHREAQL